MEAADSINDIQSVSTVHVVFLHNKFKKRHEDRYIVDMANALQQQGHRVSIYASELEKDNAFEEFNETSGNLNVSYCGWWLPRRWKFIRSTLMALRMILFPPTPMPTIIVMDIDTIALYLLSFLSTFKLIYVTHFSSLQHADIYTKFIKITPDLVSAKALKYADEILVQGEGLAEVFRRSFPMIQKELRILHPCVDTGLWKEEPLEIERIVPDLPRPSFLYVCFGTYKKRSNFKLVLQAFEDLLLISAPKIKNNIHLVIAGQCSDSQLDELVYYNELQESTKEKNYASQVTFLRHLPTVYRKTLIEESIGVIMPCKYELFPDTVLAVMACSRPIIATNTGFPKEVLRHRISAILVEPTPHLFAAAMYKVLTNPTIQVFLSDMGHELFMKHYCYAAFKKKINGIVRQYTEPQVLFVDKLKNC